MQDVIPALLPQVISNCTSSSRDDLCSLCHNIVAKESVMVSRDYSANSMGSKRESGWTTISNKWAQKGMSFLK